MENQFPQESDDARPDDVVSAGSGVLYVVATPIGNLRDITIRAIEVLQKADFIAAEDTRHTGHLLKFHGISGRLVSLHEHNEKEKATRLIERMERGQSVALVSDAGTPSVSDPGYRLISAAIDRSIRVVPIPGPSAAVTALSASGLPTDTFVFIGFLPKKKIKRADALKAIVGENRTIILYESPRRIISLLEEIIIILGNRRGVLAREMTKTHEEFIRGDISHILGVIRRRDTVKGECTLLIDRAEKACREDLNEIGTEIDGLLQKGGQSVSDVSRLLSGKYGFSRKEIYQKALARKKKLS